MMQKFAILLWSLILLLMQRIKVNIKSLAGSWEVPLARNFPKDLLNVATNNCETNFDTLFTWSPLHVFTQKKLTLTKFSYL